MTDFDKVRIISNGTELIVLEPNLEEHGDPVGGSLMCLDITGNVGVALQAAGAQFGGTSILIRNGGINIVDSAGQSRIRIHPGDPLAGENGGTILLNASDDAPSPTPGGGPPPSAIVLNASKRSLVINSPNGKARVELGPGGDLHLGGDGKDGDLVLRDGSGKERIKLGASEQRLQILSADGTPIVNLGTYGNLTLGGSGNDGDIILSTGEGKQRITLGADEMKLVIKNDTDKLVEIGGSNGDIFVNGQITVKGNIRHQRITERSRAVKQNQTYSLFSLDQNGAFIVELAASAFDPNVINNMNMMFARSSYLQWIVFTHKDASNPLEIFPMPNVGGIWAAAGPTLSAVSGHVRLSIGDLGSTGYLASVLSEATLSVRALYGSLLDF